VINNYFLLISLFFLSVFFACSETSLFSLDNLKLEKIKNKLPRIGSIISKLLGKPEKLLVTILICNLGVNIFITLIAIKIFPAYIAVPLTTIVIVIFAETVPKIIAITFSYSVSIIVAPFIYLVYLMLSPFSFIFHKTAEVFVNISLLFFKEKKESHSLQNEEMQDVIKESLENGALNKEEGIILSNLINFSNTDIYSVIKPRNSIFTVSFNDNLSGIIKRIKEKKFTKIPVWENNEENIVGILYAKDLVNLKNLRRKLSSVQDILKKPMFVPDSIKAEALLKQFRAEKNNIAIVIDEFGQVSGLITLEDIIEEIIGEIVDKEDVKPLYHRYNSRMIEVEAKMEIKELNKVFKLSLKPEQAVSVAGFILEKIRRIPDTGELIRVGNIQFTISSATPNKIERIMITKLDKRQKPKAAENG
jgi:putative hemolysin